MSAGRTHGFSLVELLVALGISLVVLAGITRSFIVTGHGYRLQETLARLQENARYVLETLATDLRRTGYRGGITDLQRIEDTTPAGLARGRHVARDDGTCTGPQWALMLGYRVFGLDDTRRNYACLPPGGATRGDVLVVRYMAPWQVGGVTTPAFQPRQYYLRASVYEGRLFRGADQAANPVSGAPVRVAELVARAYYIQNVPRSRSGCARQGPVPALYRTSLANGRLVSREIARGVEQLQVQYGVDGDGDGSVDRYRDAPAAGAVTAWRSVIAIRFWILLRSECPETSHTDPNSYRLGNIRLQPADGYRRRLYAQTVHLRNGGRLP